MAHQADERHAHALRAVVEQALVEDGEQRVKDGAVGLEHLVDEGDAGRWQVAVRLARRHRTLRSFGVPSTIPTIPYPTAGRQPSVGRRQHAVKPLPAHACSAQVWRAVVLVCPTPTRHEAVNTAPQPGGPGLYFTTELWKAGSLLATRALADCGAARQRLHRWWGKGPPARHLADVAVAGSSGFKVGLG